MGISRATMADPNKTLFGDSDDSDADTPAADSQGLFSEPVAEEVAPQPEPAPSPAPVNTTAAPASPQMDSVRITPKSSGAPAESLSSSGIGVKADAGVDDEDPEPFQLPDPNPAFQIEVCNPAVQDQSSMRAFVTYEVKSQISHTDYSDNQYEVMRRYSDFEWLHNRLIAELPHLNVPPLPEKAAMGNLEMKFINLRKQMLSKFMIRCTHHEDILNSDGFKIFLTKDMGPEFDGAKKQLPPPREFSAEEKKVGFFAKMKNKVTASVPKELSVPKCAEYFQYTQTRAQKMSKLLPAGGSYVGKCSDLAKATGEMGIAMQEFGKAMETIGSGSDEDHGPLCAAYNLLGETLQEIAEHNTDVMCREEALLVSNVTENINLLKGGDRLFEERKKALKTYCGVKDGKLVGIDESEAEKNFNLFDDMLQPQLEEANANVDKDTQTLLFSLATSRKSALIKELQQWEEFEKKLESL